MVLDLHDRDERRARLGLGPLERPGDDTQLRQLRHDVDQLLTKMRTTYAPLAERLTDAGRANAGWLKDTLAACRRSSDMGSLYSVSVALAGVMEGPHHDAER